MMQLLVYDGSFEGFLSAVFDVYEYKMQDVKIVKQSVYNVSVFEKDSIVHTSSEKATRVWKGLEKYTPHAVESLYHSWLSELPNIEKPLLQYMQYVFQKKAPVQDDYSNAAVLKIAQVAKKVHRERHRMEAFIRFQLTGDGLYYALIDPDFNVLPLLAASFQKPLCRSAMAYL